MRLIQYCDSALPDTPFQRWLHAHGACMDAAEWVWDKTPEEAWELCAMSGWMIWFLYETDSIDDEQRDHYCLHVLRYPPDALRVRHNCPIIEEV